MGGRRKRIPVGTRGKKDWFLSQCDEGKNLGITRYAKKYPAAFSVWGEREAIS